MKKQRFTILWQTLLASCWSFACYADWQMNMPRGVTPISQSIYSLHMIIFWICVAIGVVVFGVMLYALVMHRKSRGYQAATFHEHTSLEIVWAVIPFIILVVMAIPATKVLMAMDDSSAADLTIKVTGLQWKWKYDYLENNISFYSNMSTPMAQIQNKEKKGRNYLMEVDNELVVPTHRKIRFLVTSVDVIHSWWVNELGIKRDAIPGFVNEAWARIDKPGVYRGRCAELCGIYHGYMPVVVRALPEDEFDQWVASKTKPKAKPKPLAVADEAAAAPAKPSQPLSKEELMTLGKTTYEKICVACHKADGTGMPPVFPALKASSVAVGRPISRHINIILWGVEGSAMQSFAAQLSDAEIAAVVTYERNAWGNNTGDVVQAAAVAKLRAKKSAP